jgi:hypothetical protein
MTVDPMHVPLIAGAVAYLGGLIWCCLLARKTEP